MFLSEQDIRERLSKGDLGIDPPDPSKRKTPPFPQGHQVIAALPGPNAVS